MVGIDLSQMTILITLQHRLFHCDTDILMFLVILSFVLAVYPFKSLLTETSVNHIWNDHETLKYWTDVMRAQSYFIGRCLFSLGWAPIWWWYHNKNTLWSWCFVFSTSLTPNVFLLAWLKLNLILLDPSRLA